VRIAYVIPAYPPAASQPFVVNEMVEVQEAGHEIVLLPLYETPPSPVRHATFARLRPLAVLPPAMVNARDLPLALWVAVTHPVRTLATLLGLHRAAGLNPWAHAKLLVVAPKALAAAWRLRRLSVERIHAHWAHQSADCAAIASRVSGIPFSFTAHAFEIYSNAPKLRNETLVWKLRHATQAFAVSDYAADLLRRKLPPSERGRVHTVRVGIPLHLFRPEPPRPRDGLLRLLCICRYVDTKGLDTLVDACAVLRERGVRFHLQLFGDGPLRPMLAARIARLELERHVTLGTPIPQERVAEELRSCHAFVMPCRRDRTGDMDGIPTAFMEAMATGRPVVSCPVSGVPELVRDGETGLLAPSDDPAAFAAAVERLAADEALAVRLGRQGRALVERQHDAHLNARRVVALFGPTARGAATPVAPPAVETRTVV
jgi:glycosyltransferase involved in cell wall biosynthesis